MDTILDHLEDLTRPRSMPPEYFAVSRPLGPLHDKIKETLTLKFLDELNNAQADVVAFERRECFSRGFRLGVRLTLEGLSYHT
ncbi:MAG: hypothetical protein J6J87_05830 [Oscillospiraceae bacterium]|nr:hypothetical protein [Oscillospiraceae bacterium]